jgi:hypothetical protein
VLYSGKTSFCHKAASRRQYIEYETDSVAASAAYKIVLFELRRSNAVAEIKFFRYRAEQPDIQQNIRLLTVLA